MGKKNKKENEITDDKEKKKKSKKNKAEMASEKNKVKLNSEKRQKRERRIKVLKLGLLISLLFLIVIYFILVAIYSQGAFTVCLDQDFAKKSGVIIFDDYEKKESRRVLTADELEYMDNISVKWLPPNINDEADGAHNGDNYIAYTFYVQNLGSETVNYWYEILIDDVIKEIDKAIRVMVYQNGEPTIYAKANSQGSAEQGTEIFYSDESVMLKKREAFNSGDIDKYTIVIWIEGDDPECVDALIGGQMKMHLEINEERRKQDKT